MTIYCAMISHKHGNDFYHGFTLEELWKDLDAFAKEEANVDAETYFDYENELCGSDYLETWEIEVPEPELTDAYAVTQNGDIAAIFLEAEDANVDAEERCYGQGDHSEIDMIKVKVPKSVFGL